MKFSRLAVGGALLAVVVTSSALTLGRLRGNAWIGQPLDVTVPFQAETEDENRLSCFAAEVIHGEAALDPARIKLSIEPGASSQESLLRIRSVTAIEEPVVTLTVRSTCAGSSTRKFVMLADLPGQTPVVVSPVVPVPLPGPANSLSNSSSSPNATRLTQNSVPGIASSSGTQAPRSADGISPAESAPSAAPRRQPPRRAPAAVHPAAAPRSQVAAPAPNPAAVTAAPPVRAATAPTKPAPVAAPAAVTQPTAAVASRPRLKLESVDSLVDADTSLKPSGSILSIPATNDQQRAEAAATWKSLNTDPVEAARAAQRLQTLEGDVQKMREMMVRNQALMLDMQSQLQRAESERYANPVVYILAALLLAALAAMAVLWKRSSAANNQAQWWGARDRDAAASAAAGGVGANEDSSLQPELSLPADFLASVMASREQIDSRGTGQVQGSPSSVSNVDFDLDDIDSVGALTKAKPAHLATAAVAAAASARREGPLSIPPHADFSPSVSGRLVNAEELFDIQQQADFFVSLGQYDQAIDVLKSHIQANPDTSALAYLDLFTIYHELESEAAYTALRGEFTRIFNADVPTFEAFRNQSRGLEDYPRTLTRITKSWPKHRVLRIIEESIFRRPGALEEDVSQAFDLEAYRELLLLFAIAKDVADEDSQDFLASTGGDSLPSPMLSPSQPMSLSPLQSIRYPDTDHPGTIEMDAIPDIIKPPASPNLGLDIDLTDDEIAFEAAPTTQQPNSETVAPVDKGSEFGTMDFDLFDSSTEAQLAPKRSPKP